MATTIPIESAAGLAAKSGPLRRALQDDMPPHLRTLAKVKEEVELEVAAPRLGDQRDRRDQSERNTCREPPDSPRCHAGENTRRSREIQMAAGAQARRPSRTPNRA